MTSKVAISSAKLEAIYQSMAQTCEEFRKKLNRPLTLGEKIIYSHLDDKSQDPNLLERGKSFVLLRPDRVAMQDATAQMAILQFIQSGKRQTAVPSTVHCDHLVRAHTGAAADLKTANNENAEVFDFLKSASNKYGIGFWGPGSGIIHQIVLENYAFPGGLIIGTDSHTPNGGGLGTAAIGVGGADAVDVMAGLPWELLLPKLVGIHLKGKLKSWTSPKDIILKVLEILTVKGGTNKIVEYFGEGAESISCTGKATITNMGAELGATTSVFAYDDSMATYLNATKRSEFAKLAEKYKANLAPDPEIQKDPKKYYDEVIEIDLDQLEPYIVGPHSPDLARPVSRFKDDIKRENYPSKVSATLIGSCTNSSYEDISRAAHIAEEAMSQGIKAKIPLWISPGSAQIYATIKRDGQLKTLEDFGGKVLSNACGPCIGQWKRDDIKKGDKNSIVTSFNRNFRGRNDANAETLGFISSPEMVIAYAVTGDLNFNPLTDSMDNGKKLSAPQGDTLPKNGFVEDISGYIEPADQTDSLTVDVKPGSDRLQLLAPFTAFPGGDYLQHTLLVKVSGKCTTDHISPAGQWLKFRGHLENISDNMLLGAVNSAHSEPGKGISKLDGQANTLSHIAKTYKQAQKPWVIIGDDNYGEGSSREHAAMCPRFLGCSTIIVKSFARIHETNLKKQGVLALTFANPSDYDKIEDSDEISVLGLDSFTPGVNLKVKLHHKSGSIEEIEARHSYNADQVSWFKAGSALNLIKP